MSESAVGRAGGAGGCPTVCAGIVSSAGIQIVVDTVIKNSAPNDHFTAGPHCRGIRSAVGRVGSAGGCPTVGSGIVSAASIQVAVCETTSSPAPDDHFTSGPDCLVKPSGSGRVAGAGSYPTVCSGTVSPASIEKAAGIGIPAPDDHFTAGPDCRLKLSAVGRADNARCSPCVIGARINPWKSIGSFA